MGVGSSERRKLGTGALLPQRQKGAREEKEREGRETGPEEDAGLGGWTGPSVQMLPAHRPAMGALSYHCGPSSRSLVEMDSRKTHRDLQLQKSHSTECPALKERNVRICFDWPDSVHSGYF